MYIDSNNPQTDPKSYCLMGVSLATYNMGVSALTASLIKILRKKNENAKISLLIGNKSSDSQILKVSETEKLQINVVNYRLSPKAKLKEHLFVILFIACICRLLPIKTVRNKIISKVPFLDAISKADFIGDIRGGDSFSDIYGFNRLAIGSIPSLIVLIMKKELTLLPQTYGPYKSKVGKIIAKIIFNKSKRIMSRDQQGIGEIVKISREAKIKEKITFCPDVAFVLNAIKPDKFTMEKIINKERKYPLVGFNVNGLMFNGGYTRGNMFGLKLDYREFSRKITLKFLKETDAHILFIPHTYNPPVESDPQACRSVIESIDKDLKDRMHIIKDKYDQSEIKWIIGHCDFFVGSRMHACIAALSQAIPTIAVAYSKKFTGVFNSVNASEMVVDGRTLTTEEALQEAFHKYNRAETLKHNLYERTIEIESVVYSRFDEVI
jgi:colanic acid/amylovoran biosynthesis protein